jgi:hypothetical protein
MVAGKLLMGLESIMTVAENTKLARLNNLKEDDSV